MEKYAVLMCYSQICSAPATGYDAATRHDHRRIEHPVLTVFFRMSVGLMLSALLSDLDTFFIEVEFIGDWTEGRQAVFKSAADRLKLF